MMFTPEKHMRILRWVLGSMAAGIGLAMITAWMLEAWVIGLWVGIPCLVFAIWLMVQRLRQKWLVRKLIRQVKWEGSRR